MTQLQSTVLWTLLGNVAIGFFAGACFKSLTLRAMTGFLVPSIIAVIVIGPGILLKSGESQGFAIMWCMIVAVLSFPVCAFGLIVGYCIRADYALKSPAPPSLIGLNARAGISDPDVKTGITPPQLPLTHFSEHEP